MERGLQRNRQQRYQRSSLYISASSGTDIERTFFVTPPDVACKLLRLRIDPESAYTASGSNFWTVSLKTRSLDGNNGVTVPQSVRALDVDSLSTNVILQIPAFGEWDYTIPPDYAVQLAIVETGTGTSSLVGTFHLDWLLGT